jgi:hypothetical protein
MGGVATMGALVRWVFPLVGYLCVATVVSAALGYGYLRRSGKLDDETMFRITALLHGVDLEELEKAGEKTVEETPPEEPSFAQQQEQVQAATLHFDAKHKQLEDSLTHFDYQLERVSEATARYTQLRVAVDQYLTQQRDQVTNEARQKVRAQLEGLVPKKQAKPLLIKMIDADQIDEVILLLNSMKPRSQQDILRTFDTVDDIDRLYQVQQRMLAGAPAKPYIDAQLEQLKQLQQQEK